MEARGDAGAVAPPPRLPGLCVRWPGRGSFSLWTEPGDKGAAVRDVPLAGGSCCPQPRPANAHPLTRACAHTLTHIRGLSRTWIFLFNPHNNSRRQRAILNFQLPGNETEGQRGEVSSERWIPTQARWLQCPKLLARTHAFTNYVPDATCRPRARHGPQSSTQDRLQSLPHGASSGHRPT